MITVITVVFNNLDGLKRTARSVLEQSYQRYLWVVVDGGSSDGSREYMFNLVDQFPEKILFISEVDDGLYDAMNKGLKLASYDGYIVFMNSGDCFYDFNTLFGVVSRIDATGKCLYAGHSVRFSSDRFYQKKPKNPSHLVVGMMCEHQAAFFKASIAKKISYDLRYSLSADYDFFINFMSIIGPDGVEILDFPICMFEFGGISYSKRNEAILEDALIRVRRKKANVLLSVLIVLIQYGNHKIKKMFRVIR